jgi:hypothetical protein
VRVIQVTTEVFAAIWADRKPGEESESDILARKYGVASVPLGPKRDIQVTVGWHDPKHGVRLPVGFTINRHFKGKEYSAQAIQGFWVSSHDGKGYANLNDLSIAIGAGGENAWNGWWCVDPETGTTKRISELRDPSTVRKVKA